MTQSHSFVLIRFLQVALLATYVLIPLKNADAHEVIRNIHMTNANGAVANGVITLDLDLVTLQVQMEFSGLSSGLVSSQIHATTDVPQSGVAPVATLNFFDTSNLSTQERADLLLGKYNHTFDLTVASSYNSAFITSSGGTVSDALNKLIFAAEDERSYLTIRTLNFPSGDGELKGFLTAVPEPSSWMTLGVALTIAIGYGYRRNGLSLRAN